MDVNPRDYSDPPVTITGMSYGLTATIDLQRRTELPTLSSPLVSSVMYKMRYVFVYGQAQSTRTPTHTLTRCACICTNRCLHGSMTWWPRQAKGALSSEMAWVSVRGRADMPTCILAYVHIMHDHVFA